MSQTTQMSVVTFASERILPVVVIDDESHAAPLREALKAGGLNCAEVTLRTKAARDSIRIMAEDPTFVVGAGTVTSPAQAEQAYSLGARFMVSPGVSAEVVRACQALDMSVFPGVITPTEVMTALDLGLTELKFFPAATAGGIPALQALGGPFGSVRFIPTGGVSAANASDYLSLPNVAAIGGSWLTPPAAMADGDFDIVARLTAEAVALAASLES